MEIRWKSSARVWARLQCYGDGNERSNSIDTRTSTLEARVQGPNGEIVHTISLRDVEAVSTGIELDVLIEASEIQWLSAVTRVLPSSCD